MFLDQIFLTLTDKKVSRATAQKLKIDITVSCSHLL